jgi:hypothetical protein
LSWGEAGLALLAFALTAAETSVSAVYTRAIVARRRWPAVIWGVVFEAVLLADIWFLVSERWLAVPILVGAGVGIWWIMRDPRV